MPDPNDHALLQPRSQVAIGLVGVWGVGVGLMAAHVDVILGSFIALMPPIGVLWLYWEHLKSASRALRTTAIVEGTTFKEIALAIMTVGGMLFVDALMSIQAYYNEEPNLPTSRLTIEIVWPVDIPGKNPVVYKWRNSYSNSGPASLTNSAGLTMIKQYESEPTEREVDADFEELKNRFTTTSLDEDKKELYPSKQLSGDVTGAEISQAQYESLISGKANYMYASIIRYDDDNTPKGKHRFTYFCARLIVNPTQQRLCSKNNKMFTASDINGR